MKQTGTGFTWNGRRYEPGDLFDLGSVPVWQRGTLTRLYGLTDRKTKVYIKKESHNGL